MPMGLLSDIYIFVEQFNVKIIEIEEMLTENSLVDIGVVTAKNAMDC